MTKEVQYIGNEKKFMEVLNRHFEKAPKLRGEIIETAISIESSIDGILTTLYGNAWRANEFRDNILANGFCSYGLKVDILSRAGLLSKKTIEKLHGIGAVRNAAAHGRPFMDENHVAVQDGKNRIQSLDELKRQMDEYEKGVGEELRKLGVDLFLNRATVEKALSHN